MKLHKVFEALEEALSFKDYTINAQREEIASLKAKIAELEKRLEEKEGDEE